MSRVMMRIAMVTMAGLLPGVAAADALDDLLADVKRSQQQAIEINEEREERFLRERNRQDERLREAQRELAAIERKTEQQKAEFEATAKEIAELKTELEEQTGELEQLFGTIRTAAGDARAVIRDSLTSAQYPDRLEVLGRLADGERRVSLDQLEAFWFVLQQELIAAGRVTTFPADIVDDNGQATAAQVSRVGVFTAVADGQFLNYLPEAGRLQALPRQPGGGAQSQARDFANAAPGTTPAMLIDPTRGNLLALLTERPGLSERIRQGGVVGYIIIALGIIGLLLAIGQSLWLMRTGARMRRQLRDIEHPRDDNPLGRLLGALESAIAEGDRDLDALELTLDEGVIRETPRLERAQSVIKLLAGVAPLLGLLGTVTGMIATFQSITLFGTGDPKLMAGGISQALMTTVLGLVVAIPLLFLHSLLATRSRSLVRMLDEQAAGLIARRLEADAARRG